MRGYDASGVLNLIKRQNETNKRIGIKEIPFTEEAITHFIELVNRHPELFERQVQKRVTAADVIEEFRIEYAERIDDMFDYAAEVREENDHDCYD